MKRKISFPGIIIFALIIVFTMTACDNGDGGNVTPAMYTVTYDGNTNTGGTVPTDGNSPYQNGATVTVLGNTGNLAKTDNTFAGWNTAANGSGTPYAAGATFVISADTILYAQWSIKTDPTVNWPVGLQVEHGKTLSAITLPANGSGTAGVFTWTTSTTSVGSIGEQSHSVTFTPNDTAVYNTKTQNITIRVCPVGMAWIPNGIFTMGSPTGERQRYSDETQHQVTLTKGFYLGKYQVTQAKWKEVMGNANNPSNFKTSDNLPVETVSWYDALVFCNKLSADEGLNPAYEIEETQGTNDWTTDTTKWGTVPTTSDARWNNVRIAVNSNGYRLPTEAQWEYACRAGTETAFYNGNNYDGGTGYDATEVGKVAWFSGNSGSKTQEVGQKTPNAWGLYDMHGNVFEWCWDWFENFTSTAQTDPTGAVTGSIRVVRGGSWFDGGRSLRSAYRLYNNPSYRLSNVGFRLVRP